MKIIKFTLPFLVTFFITTGVVHANAALIKIRTLFNIKDSFCSIRTNGVTGLDNRESTFDGYRGAISSTNSLLFMENGENEISLEIGSSTWFSEKHIDDSVRAVFPNSASCKIDLIRWDNNKQSSLASISVSIGKDGNPEKKSDHDNSIILKKITAEQVIPGHIDPEYFSERYYPKNMELYKFTKKIHISGIPDWKWVSATPFTGTDEQINGLRSAYLELAKIINMRDRKLLKNSHSIALEAWSKTTGESEDDILLSQYPKEDIEDGKVKIDPIKWNDYSVRIMNQGRIVQFYNKSNPDYSPLSFHSKDEDGNDVMGYYAPMLSLINGKFVVVL
ncbi:hypothetical protein [Rahnella laticis]|uniref:hypothetical protein n=1 Tax=Rahnella laticis TaxID=2787622 RepID=UPI001E3820BC|nr:hypothetical protein [Rahnella laticis]